MYSTEITQNSNQEARESIGGAGGNYRKVFKPNFGDDEPQRQISRQTSKPKLGGKSNGYNKPSARPPMNNRLPRKVSQGYGGIGEDEDNGYKPTQRNNGMRSNRINNKGGYNKQSSIGSTGEIGRNVPRASKKPKKPFNSVRSKQRYGDAFGGETKQSSGISESLTAKTGSKGYEMEFGDDAFEQPQSLIPCPS